MAEEDIHLIGPDEIAYRLDLTPAQLKVTWTALKSLLDDFGHDERDVANLIREVIDKLPDADSIRAIDLTATEFQLLATLARQPGRIFTRAQLLDAIQGESFDRAIDTHVKNIRRKLEPDARTPRYLITVYGLGYKFGDA